MSTAIQRSGLHRDALRKINGNVSRTGWAPDGSIDQFLEIAVVGSVIIPVDSRIGIEVYRRLGTGPNFTGYPTYQELVGFGGPEINAESSLFETIVPGTARRNVYGAKSVVDGFVAFID